MVDFYRHAITRSPGPQAPQGLTTAGLGSPDVDRLMEQHENYVNTLRTLGLQVIELDPLADYPDAHFVEDAAIVTPEVAIITNPGAPSRQGEQVSIEAALSPHRPTVQIAPPGTLDGGDVLAIGSHYFVGLSARTNQCGAEQLGEILEGLGYTWSAITVSEGLHLKSSANYVGDDHLLVAEQFADRDAFQGYNKIIAPVEEHYAANSLWVNDCLIIPAGYPKTRVLLGTTGLDVMELEMSEMQKLDGGLTCLSLRF